MAQTLFFCKYSPNYLKFQLLDSVSTESRTNKLEYYLIKTSIYAFIVNLGINFHSHDMDFRSL